MRSVKRLLSQSNIKEINFVDADTIKIIIPKILGDLDKKLHIESTCSNMHAELTGRHTK